MRVMKDSGIAWIGEIPEEWKVSTIKREYHFQTGWTPDTTHEDYFLGGNIWVNISDLKSATTYDSEKHISNEAVQSSSMNISPKGSLMYAFKLSVGAVSFCGRDMYTNEAIATFLPGKNSLRFLYYMAPIFIIKNANENIYGAKLLNQRLIRNAKIIIPPIAEQERIADYLDRKCSQIDAIIARQQEVIEKLKAYKLSVITEAVTKGLNPHAPMKDSGVEWIGKVPEQWKVAKLKFVASFYNGDRSSKYPSGTDIVDEGVIFVTSNNLGNTFLDTTISTKYITKEKYDDLGGAKIRINDIIFCLRGSVGKCSINKSENEGTIASSLVVIRAKKILADYLIFALQCPGITAVSTLNAIGIGSLNLSADDISEIFIPIPPEKEAAEIAEFLYKRIGKIDHVINEKNNYVNHFVMYKKSLIYEVVTGKKEV